MIKHIAVGLLAIAMASAGKVPITSCPRVDAPPPYSVYVPSCDTPPCILLKGETYTVEIDFDVVRNTTSMTTIVSGIILGLELPWAGVGSDGCKDMKVGACPLHKGDYVTYGAAIKVEEVYPSTALTIKWRINDDAGVPIFCFLLPAEIK